MTTTDSRPDRPQLTLIQRSVLRRISRLNLPAHARVLDAPCGAPAALSLALKNEGFSVTGADLDETAASVLGEAFAPVNLNAKLPWADDSFDLAISTEGVEHLENHFALFREFCRVLRPNGVLIMTTPNITALRSRVRFFGSGFFGRDARPLNESGRHPLHHVSLATFPELRYELHVSGFQLLEVRHTHIKPISYLYLIYAPWMWLYTRIAFRKEKDTAQRQRNREILRSLLSPSLLLGECLMLIAEKTVGWKES
jgi:2-polyprenyl-3-methyl-5-hydroxy-6-metoxy-1,4-benzoquinol methylase